MRTRNILSPDRTTCYGNCHDVFCGYRALNTPQLNVLDDLV
jgi:hypothetical protein